MNQVFTLIGPVLSLLMGRLAPFVMEYLKNNPAVTFITPETIALIRFLLTLFAVVSGAGLAYLAGGTFDFNAGVTAIVDAAIFAYTAHTTYHAEIKE
jgi:hypothetical protein